MQRPFRWFVALFAVVLGFNMVIADDNEKKPAEEKAESAEERLEKIVKLGPGVHAIKKDKKGRIVSCLVVGQSRISTALGKAKGEEIARDRAGLQTSAEFIKWLKQSVSIRETSEDESVILLAGMEGDNGESLDESGKAIEKTSKRMESVSQGLVRGLIVLHTSVNAEDKTYTVIKGWKADTAEGVKRLAKSLASDEPQDEKPAGKAAGGKSSKSGKNADKEIKDKKATAAEVKDFLP